MLQFFPFLAWLAVVTSAGLLVTLRATGDIGARGMIVCCAWCCAAAWCQFFGASPPVVAAGLSLQTILAVCLLVRWNYTREG